MTIKRPNIVKVFAGESSYGQYLPVKFGTNIPVSKTNYSEVANDNFEYGLESLEGDLQLKDLNSVFFYQGKLLQYLFQQGVPEFSAYQDYPVGALVQYNGDLWVSTKEVKASLVEVKPIKAENYDPCAMIDACSANKICQQAEYPSTANGWCKLVTHCTFDHTVTELRETDKALQQSIDNLKGVEGFEVKTFNNVPSLVLHLSDGSNLTIPMTKFGSIKQLANGNIFITNPDGSQVVIKAHKATTKVVDAKGNLIGFTHPTVYEDDTKSFTDTVTVLSEEMLISGNGLILDADNNLKVKLLDLIDRDSLKIKSDGTLYVDLPAIVDGTSLIADANGNLAIKPEYTESAKANTIRELKTLGATVYTSNSFSGDGTKVSPLDIKLSEDFTVNADGKLALKNNAPSKFTSFTDGYKFGFHIFNGYTEPFIVGLPININSEDKEQDRALSSNDIQGERHYDFNGYYIASSNQLDVWLQGTNNTAWYIMNDDGINPDGSLKNTNGWGKWQKLDNASSITDTLVTNMQNQINDLARDNNSLLNKVNALETKNNETCKIPVATHGSYTLQDTDNTIICTGGTITVPSNIPVGRLFTVIQSTGNAVNIRGDGGLQVIAPMDGSLKLAGANAVVTILITGNREARVFGQTE